MISRINEGYEGCDCVISPAAVVLLVLLSSPSPSPECSVHGTLWLCDEAVLAAVGKWYYLLCSLWMSHHHHWADGRTVATESRYNAAAADSHYTLNMLAAASYLVVVVAVVQ